MSVRWSLIVNDEEMFELVFCQQDLQHTFMDCLYIDSSVKNNVFEEMT